MKPLISILIPCYNGAKFLESCLNSCLSQTYSNIEIIVINDGSTDNSLEILNQYAGNHSNIKVYSQENQGLAETRNRLIEYTNGEYFFFLDVDDLIPNNAIENLYNGSDNGNNYLVVGRTMWLINNKFRFPFVPTWWKTKNMNVYHYVKSNICTPWAVIIKTEYFRSLNIHFIKGEIFEDVGVMPYVYIKAENKFNFIKNIVYNYRVQNDKDNLSNFQNNYQHKIFSIYQQANQILSLMEREGFNNQKKYRRYVNGINYEILLLIFFLSNNYGTKTRFKKDPFEIAPRFNILTILNNFGYKTIRFSKTFWKSISFFFIKIGYLKIIRSKNKENLNLTRFLNQKIIKNQNQYKLLKWSDFDETKANKGQIIVINEADITSFKEMFLKLEKEKKVIKNKVLLEVHNELDLLDFIEKHMKFFIKNRIVLGVKMDHFFEWKMILKDFVFVYSDDYDVLKYISEQDLKLITFSNKIDDKTLVNFLVDKHENI